MKNITGLKMGTCGVLTALAVITSASALTGGEQRGGTVDGVENKQTYILRECDGYVGIFSNSSAHMPETITGIEVQTLPEADQDAIARGLSVEGKEQLMMILEDLGS